MLKPRVIFAILGVMALLIAGLTVFFVMNMSSITLLKSGVLIGVAVLGLIVILVGISLILRGILTTKK